jgi:hypothetical protein
MFTKKINSASIASGIDSITKQFTTMVDSLKQKAEEASVLKQEKEVEIQTLQTECDALKRESERALNLADKIANIFN